MRYLLVIAFFALAAAIPPADPPLEQLRQQWQRYEATLPQENVYLSLSEEIVAAGDTVWFGGYLSYVQKASKVLYVELVRDGRSLQQESYFVNRGFTQGQISIPDSLSSGLYQLRAYTQWMRNTGETSFFYRPLLVINPYDDDPPVPLRGGSVDTQLRSTPESGTWVAGLPARLKLSLGGKENQSLRGAVIRQEDSVKVADISLSAGIDLLSMQSETGENYRAEIYLPSGDTLVTTLPAAQVSGCSMQVEVQDNQLNISVYSTEAAPRYLMVRSADKLLYSELLQQKQFQTTIPLNLRKTALLEVSVLDEKANVLAERLIYHQVQPLMANIQLDKTNFSARDSVRASLSLPAEADGSARLSVSVRKVNPFSGQQDRHIGHTWAGLLPVQMEGDLSPEQKNHLLIGEKSPFPSWKEILSGAFSEPVFRQEDEYLLLSGTLGTPSGEAVNDEMVMLSVPGRNPHFDYGMTDEEGRFHLPVYDVYGEKEVVLQIPNDSLPLVWSLEDKFALIKDKRANKQYAPLAPQAQWDALLTHYRQRAQISAQYDPFLEEDLNKNIPRKSRFYGSPNFEINLEDYISLPSFVEICRELMPGIRLRQEGDHYVFSVFDVRTRTFLENPPGLVLDGVLVWNPDDIVSLLPSEIERIETVNRRTYYGEYRFDGMVAVYTKSGSAYLDLLPANAMRKSVTFFTPAQPFSMAEPTAAHLPDFRSLLYWKPVMNLQASEPQSIRFSNADELGTFEIVVEGVTADGSPVMGRQRYKVGAGQMP